MPTVFVGDGFVAAERAALQVSDLAIQRGYGIFDFLKRWVASPFFWKTISTDLFIPPDR
ncbi:hypothetical protein ACQ86N_37645 [Puia sp. P3]|uniref:hypothetical protein n=1 Tax=Puia sp. P3 TaxID=3423952 RepID=UPI003D67E8F6